MDKETKKEFENLAQIVKKGFDDVDQRFEQVDQRFEQVDQRFEQVDQRFDKIEDKIDNDINATKLELVDHMEEKAADIKGSLVVSIRKQDRKVNRLIEMLSKKKHLTSAEEKELIKIRPFEAKI